MKLKFKKLLSTILVAATAKVAANPAAMDFQSTKLNLPDNDGNKTSVKDKQNILQKYVLKFGSDNSYLIAGHRSHGSHRSHRSSSSGSYYTPSKNSGNSSSSSSSTTAKSSYNSDKNSNNTTATTTKNTTPRICNLGDRTISSGACGTDVKILATLLAKHDYLVESEIESNADGYTICNAAMVIAIKKFQNDAKLTQDGNANTATIKALENWQKNK